MDRHWSFVAGVCAGSVAVLSIPRIPSAHAWASAHVARLLRRRKLNQSGVDERGDVPDDANEGCVGIQSDEAGKASACQGCPNQQLCASGEARKVDPGALEVKDKLSDVKQIILVLSGKGGVGKSTVATQLAFSLSKNMDVGLLDVDICGPSIPQMLGVKGSDVHMSADGWSPVYVDERLCVMSIGFMLPDENDAIIWRGPRKNGLIKQFLTDVKWGALDALIIDTPPGTSDEHLSIVTYLKEAGISGAVIVTTPQEVALADVRKEINFCKKTEIPILGVIENMSGFTCPSCQTVSHIFSGERSGGASGMCKQMDIPYLGSIPLQANVGAAGECGTKVADSSSVAPIDTLASELLSQMRARE